MKKMVKHYEEKRKNKLDKAECKEWDHAEKLLVGSCLHQEKQDCS